MAKIKQLTALLTMYEVLVRKQSSTATLENRLAIIKVHKHLPYNLPIPL
jgi:hypothetical protein